LIAEGAEPNPDQLIGIFSQNRVEWKISEQACNSFSMVVVTLYDTLGPEAIRHIVNQCKWEQNKNAFISLLHLIKSNLNFKSHSYRIRLNLYKVSKHIGYHRQSPDRPTLKDAVIVWKIAFFGGELCVGYSLKFL